MSQPPRHPADMPVEALLAECAVTRTRRSGPGGQHRNKVETAVVLRHRPTGLTAEASERRSQPRNLAAAAARLRLKLALEHRAALDLAAGPSALWRSRCAGRRIVVSVEHDDYPPLLAEALDAAGAHSHDLAAAARWLDCTTTQLVRFLAATPAALQSVNDARRARGLKPLRP